jgi:hypothetical protein
MSSSKSAYSILVASVLASSVAEVDRGLRQLLDDDIEKITELVVSFLSQPVSPATFLQFERRLQEIVGGLGRTVMEFSCNECEPESAEDVPHDVTYEAGGFRRLDEKTPNKYVETTFGRITLWRRGYRYWHRGQKESNIFPLELTLGLIEGATPALAGEIGRMMGESGATQMRVLQQAQRQFNVSLSVGRLRDLAQGVSESMERFRQHYQVLKLLTLLKQAYASRGRYKPVLSVGRDGIYMPMEKGSGYQQGAVATVAVYDRRGQRLGTVYLASTPESGQPTLTHQLTALIKECLDKWCHEQGLPLPRLCYVTDAGDTECQYYGKVLCRLADPRRKGKYLQWNRIIDYYHTTEKITIMAEAVFGPGREASAWARKMRKRLLKPNGASRVLHSAAALRSIYGLDTHCADDFERAYNYIRSRTKHMRYAEFKKLRLPIGSGVTEAACKTVFTQRLKLSGMGWKLEGAQVVLNLRVILLSGIWDDVYEAGVVHRNPVDLKPYLKEKSRASRIAA